MRRILVGMVMVLALMALTACGLSDAENKYNAGNEKYGKQDLDGALADYNEAIRLDPNLAVAYLSRGTVYLSKNDLDKGIEDLTKAIDLKLSKVEDQSKAFTNRAAAYSAKNDFDKALTDVEEAIKIKSDYAKGYLVRGTVRQNKGDNEGAIADFNKVIELAKDSEEAKAAQQFLTQFQPTP